MVHARKEVGVAIALNPSLLFQFAFLILTFSIPSLASAAADLRFMPEGKASRDGSAVPLAACGY
jgi:hypothetical protein